MTDETKDVGGLSRVERRGLQRVPLRLRGGAVTLSGWMLEVGSAQGIATVVAAESPGGETWYRGEGALLGASQERLAEIYRSMTAPPPAASADEGTSGPQLG